MKSLQLKYNFIIIVVLLVLPTAVATYLLAENINKAIDFTSQNIVDGTVETKYAADAAKHEVMRMGKVATGLQQVVENLKIDDVLQKKERANDSEGF